MICMSKKPLYTFIMLAFFITQSALKNLHSIVLLRIKVNSVKWIEKSKNKRGKYKFIY